MIDKSVEWFLCQDFSNVPEKISLFLAQSLHGSLFQYPVWFSCVEKQKTDAFILCALKNDRPVYGALIRKSRIPGTKYFVALVTRGPVFEDIDVAINLWEEFEKKLYMQGMIKLIISPYWERNKGAKLQTYLGNIGYKFSNEMSQHSETLSIDLTKSEDEIFNEFVNSKTRNMIRKGLRLGIVGRHVKDYEEMQVFSKIYDEMCRQKGINGPSSDEFEKIRKSAYKYPSNCACIVALLDDIIIGGCIVLRHSFRVVYTWGCSTSKAMKGVPKTEIAMWTAIVWAKEVGASIFDLGGITPGAKEGSAAYGINRFKKGFSRNEVLLFQPMEKIFNPVISNLHSSLQRVKRLIVK